MCQPSHTIPSRNGRQYFHCHQQGFKNSHKSQSHFKILDAKRWHEASSAPPYGIHSPSIFSPLLKNRHPAYRDEFVVPRGGWSSVDAICCCCSHTANWILTHCLNYFSYGLYSDALFLGGYKASKVGRLVNDELEWTWKATTSARDRRDWQKTRDRICSVAGGIQTGSLHHADEKRLCWSHFVQLTCYKAPANHSVCVL